MPTLIEFQEMLRNIPMGEVQSILKEGHPMMPKSSQLLAMDEVKRRGEMQKIEEAQQAESGLSAESMMEEYMRAAQAMSPGSMAQPGPMGGPPGGPPGMPTGMPPGMAPGMPVGVPPGGPPLPVSAGPPPGMAPMQALAPPQPGPRPMGRSGGPPPGSGPPMGMPPGMPPGMPGGGQGFAYGGPVRHFEEGGSVYQDELLEVLELLQNAELHPEVREDLVRRQGELSRQADLEKMGFGEAFSKRGVGGLLDKYVVPVFETAGRGQLEGAQGQAALGAKFLGGEESEAFKEIEESAGLSDVERRIQFLQEEIKEREERRARMEERGHGGRTVPPLPPAAVERLDEHAKRNYVEAEGTSLYDEIRGDISALKDEAPSDLYNLGQALATAGFATAAGDSPYAIQNISRGAMAGVGSLDQAREAEEKRLGAAVTGELELYKQDVLNRAYRGRNKARPLITWDEFTATDEHLRLINAGASTEEMLRAYADLAFPGLGMAGLAASYTGGGGGRGLNPYAQRQDVQNLSHVTPWE